MARPSTRALHFYQELLAIKAATDALAGTEHEEALRRIEARLLVNENTRLFNAAIGSRGPQRRVEDSIREGEELMALDPESRHSAILALAVARNKRSISSPAPASWISALNPDT